MCEVIPKHPAGEKTAAWFHAALAIYYGSVVVLCLRKVIANKTRAGIQTARTPGSDVASHVTTAIGTRCGALESQTSRPSPCAIPASAMGRGDSVTNATCVSATPLPHPPFNGNDDSVSCGASRRRRLTEWLRSRGVAARSAEGPTGSPSTTTMTPGRFAASCVSDAITLWGAGRRTTAWLARSPTFQQLLKASGYSAGFYFHAISTWRHWRDR